MRNRRTIRCLNYSHYAATYIDWLSSISREGDFLVKPRIQAAKQKVPYGGYKRTILGGRWFFECFPPFVK